MAVPNDLILFHYPYSPVARRVIWYLTLRGIKYAQCIQPPTMPRPDLAALGVSYRRIPVLAIGRDIYCDSRLILRKLEARFPEGALGARSAEGRALEQLLEKWTLDTGIFARASQLLPTELPMLNNPTFIKDREQYSRRSWNKENLEKGRPEALVYLREGFELLETTLLADGREWILKTEKPSLADIEAIWPFHWITELKGALPPTVISERQYPRVYAWIGRFTAALKNAKTSLPKPVAIKGPEAARHITEAQLAEPDGEVDENDPLDLRRGSIVEVWPIDTGSSHRDRGRLLRLTRGEITIASKAESGGVEVHIHVPRWGYRVAEVASGAGAKL